MAICHSMMPKKKIVVAYVYYDGCNPDVIAYSSSVHSHSRVMRLLSFVALGVSIRPLTILCSGWGITTGLEALALVQTEMENWISNESGYEN